ncbi:uncharacterized protein I206_105905 [Kwoniella pini CBS 10737]|uniref:MICOS complex subunit mic19 n=1 Tax=Kwoniella pini CBS 10737 TaxID=1296096 RepID=A0A1B9I0R3_9TREE|nr:uncharacterized protein I206_04728 [Kwoniella pini CBS 10737]OCF49041.1 hypothetical protein I206_04728 [Kwoniella pini CBS 10737]
MGAAQSSQNVQDQVILPNEPTTSVEFSPSLISRLSSSSSNDKSDNQTTNTTDEKIKKRLEIEIENLRLKENEILTKINKELEKENLNKEKPGMSSEILSKDIEQIKLKVERLNQNKFNEGKGISDARKQVIGCYLNNPDKPLDCWKQVENFKTEVAKLEQAFVKSLQ